MRESLEFFRIEDPGSYDAKVTQGLFYNYFGYPLEWSEGYHVFGATADRVRVGGINVLIDPNTLDYAYIRQIFITEQHRNKGFGTAIIKFAVQLAAEAGLNTIAIQPTNNNNGRLYRRLNFARDSTRGPNSRYRLFLDLNKETEQITDFYPPTDGAI